MKREKAIFTGSRLYRQASDGSSQLYQEYTTDDLPFKQIVEILSNGKASLIVNNLAECRTYLNKTRKLLERRAKEISPYIAIPILIQAITDFYYGGSYKEDLPWAGTSLKISLSLIWGNVHAIEGSPKSSIKQLSTIVKIAGIFEQLNNCVYIFETFGEGCIEFRPDGIYPKDENLQKAYYLFQKTFEKRGLTFRTLGQIGQIIYENPFAMKDAIENVIRGDISSAGEFFKGTIFNTILGTSPNNLAFWGELWVRITMMLNTMLIRAKVTDNPLGIAIFEDYPVLVTEGLGEGNIQEYIMNVFWRKDWYKKRITGDAFDLNNMIVERPVLRVTNQQGIYATSSILIADSINWFVESSVLNYQGLGGVSLPSQIFKKDISERFENQVCDTFRKHNFLAGVVNEKGTWITGLGNLTLTHDAKQKMPGEIDVLAFHPITHELFVVECKVLIHPYGKNRLTNIINKLGETDSEGYHTKLRRKIEWIKNTNIFGMYPVSQFAGLIIIDQVMPGMFQGEFTVIDFEDLDNALDELYNNLQTS